MPQTPRKPTLYPIPAGTKPSSCTGAGCGRTIYFVKGATPADKTKVLSAAPNFHTKDGTLVFTDAFSPSAVADGRGFLHFVDCPAAADFKRPR